MTCLKAESSLRAADQWIMLLRWHRESVIPASSTGRGGARSTKGVALRLPRKQPAIDSHRSKGIVHFEESLAGESGVRVRHNPAVRFRLWFPTVPERTRRRAAARDPGSSRTGVGVCGVSRVRAWDVARGFSLKEGVLGQPSARRPHAMSPHTKKSHHAQWTPSTHTRTLCVPRSRTRSLSLAYC